MAASTQTIQKMYIAYFGRPADTIGLQYWADKTEAQIIAGFSASSESQALFGNQGSAAKVNAIYNNLFARDAEPAGLQYWVQKLESGQVSQAEAMYTILTQAGAGDSTAVANKLAAAEAFTAQIDTTPEILGYTGTNAAQSAREWLGKVNANATSLDAAKASAPAALAAAAGASAGDSGKAFTLTAGADAIVGTSGNDTINALSINAAGTAADTLTAFDSIDGGAGNDTLNIYTTAAENKAFPVNATVKNVETINIYNSAAAAALADASKFVGATAINQIGSAAPAAVTNLAAGTTAGFNGTTAGPLSVTAADAAATAAVALTNVAEGLTVNVIGSATGTLNSVTVTGTVADTNSNGTVDNTTVAVTAGKDVESVSVNSAVATTLTVTDGAGKKVSTVDASASAGAVTYNAASTVANVKTGAGNDTATLNTSLDATVKAASVSTGAGDDVVDVNVTSSTTGNKVTVDAGAGADKITVTSLGANAAALDVKAGDGDDTIILAGALNTAARIDGGAGTDALQLATGGAMVAENYALIRGAVSNVENLAFGAAATIDGDELLQFSQITFAAGANTATDVAASQSLVANTNLDATAKGYVASTATAAAEGAALTVKALATGAVVAKGATVDLTVAPAENGAAATTTLTGDFNSAKVTLASSVDKVAGAAATADNIAAVSFIAGAGAGANATSLTLTGNGLATIDNTAGKLTTVDASGLTGVSFNGDILANANAGLTFTGNASVKESITLGAAQDKITVGSTYGVLDTITGFDAVKETGTAKSTTDILTFDSVDLTGAAADQAAKITLSANATSLELAFVEAAAADAVDANVSFFQFEGNTYLFSNQGAASLEATDLAVKIVGLVDFADDWGVFAA